MALHNEMNYEKKAIQDLMRNFNKHTLEIFKKNDPNEIKVLAHFLQISSESDEKANDFVSAQIQLDKIQKKFHDFIDKNKNISSPLRGLNLTILACLATPSEMISRLIKDQDMSKIVNGYMKPFKEDIDTAFKSLALDSVNALPDLRAALKTEALDFQKDFNLMKKIILNILDYEAKSPQGKISNDQREKISLINDFVRSHDADINSLQKTLSVIQTNMGKEPSDNLKNLNDLFQYQLIEYKENLKTLLDGLDAITKAKFLPVGASKWTKLIEKEFIPVINQFEAKYAPTFKTKLTVDNLNKTMASLQTEIKSLQKEHKNLQTEKWAREKPKEKLRFFAPAPKVQMDKQESPKVENEDTVKLTPRK
ncbi:MAG: hypothetical protein P4M12_01355 [Gammaproteobacteria bacterium]|nr:hypothetical protein [Gammaproteobacteria bacterium]